MKGHDLMRWPNLEASSVQEDSMTANITLSIVAVKPVAGYRTPAPSTFGEAMSEDLDRAVAVEVMEWKLCKTDVLTCGEVQCHSWIDKNTRKFICWTINFTPSTDMNHAMMVVEKMREKCDIDIYCHHKYGLDDGFSVDIWGVSTWNKHLPTAICLAALAAVRAKGEVKP